ncbi:hypothetical protein [Tritonibacter mobilis]|uniref:hypothetical protein n=1 Tax=Tritonibacter mobilis TaxID=379347 RepID=UPI000806F19B|nr:hypothetical protein [Tritonibacter mobilis]
MPKERVCATSETVSAAIDPVVPLYRDWCRARRDWLAVSEEPGNEDWDSAESKEAESRWHTAFREMLKHTPCSNQGIAAFAHVLWEQAGPGSAEDTPEFIEECALPEAILIAGIWRAAGGEGCRPF